ncbi:hsp90 co-chaperone Cdc37 [Parasteatoda tepidariorum]|uniref:hsp90 co-chaperone Cdc37 n=1 Tax=Parasteatoda tepidariorum TaxID=114398 RepID=UPI00077F850D|nr:hsp90 co-chaperone Cdc37 [Parasteatoda tepidariorum]
MVDYSKWKNIEISDDEDDTHPNIDTPSLFRWRHQARLERMAEFQHEKDESERHVQESQRKILDVKEKIKYAETNSDMNMDELKAELSKLEVEDKKLQQKREELLKKEKLMPWNVDTISREGFTKTVINKSLPPKKEEFTEEEKAERQSKFNKENEKLLKKFGMFRKYDDSKNFLKEHPHLACEETANYLVLWCINLEVEEKHELMEHVAHQCICMQFILELSKHLSVDPRSCINSFFSRIQMADGEYKDAFYAELESFKQRVRDRAKARIQKLIEEAEEEERQQRLGPGGLDPLEVLESLPEALKTCFESKDIELLQKTIATMPEDEARYHINRCVDSGLWIPDAKKAEQEAAEAKAAEVAEQ